jgi:hypothetical protein
MHLFGFIIRKSVICYYLVHVRADLQVIFNQNLIPTHSTWVVSETINVLFNHASTNSKT